MSVGVLFILFVVFLIIAIPVGITLGITAVLPHIFDPSFTVGAKYLVRAMFGGLDSFPLLAVPMFVLSGIIMAKGGISRKIFDVFAYFFGRFTAGMPCAVIVTCLFYGAISGSAPATVAAVGSMTAPILIGLGYDKTFTTSVVAVAGGLGVIIPPSIPFIMYGMASGASVSDLFLAGIIPGLVIAALLMLGGFILRPLTPVESMMSSTLSFAGAAFSWVLIWTVFASVGMSNPAGALWALGAGYTMQALGLEAGSLLGRWATSEWFAASDSVANCFNAVVVLAFIGYLRQQGVDDIYLQTWSGNERMIHIAQKMGFAEHRRKAGIRTVRGKSYDGLTFRLDPVRYAAFCRERR